MKHTNAQGGGWAEEVPALKIELMADGCLRLEAEDPFGNGPDVVSVHPMHLRLMAERLGLACEMSASEADALRTISKLGRRLRLLQERIDHLDDYLVNCSDHAHAVLDYEMAFSAATLDLADEFCRELDESGAVVTPRHTASRVTQRDARKVATPAEQLDLGAGHD